MLKLLFFLHVYWSTFNRFLARYCINVCVCMLRSLCIFMLLAKFMPPQLFRLFFFIEWLAVTIIIILSKIKSFELIVIRYHAKVWGEASYNHGLSAWCLLSWCLFLLLLLHHFSCQWYYLIYILFIILIKMRDVAQKC